MRIFDLSNKPKDRSRNRELTKPKSDQIMTAQTASKTKVFVIENDEAIETNLYDHVMKSASECTSPRGVMTELFTEEVEICEEQENGSYVTIPKYRLCQWLAGTKYHVVNQYDTEEDADNALFIKIYDTDFQQDDQRDTNYYYTIEEANEILNERQ